MTKTQRNKIRSLTQSGLTSGYFFSNSKTYGISVDFSMCKLMDEIKPGVFSSKICKSCYSAQILTIYTKVAKKIKMLPERTPESLKAFENDCKIINIAFPEITKLRFYGLADFHPLDMPYILVASKYFTVDIISKSLVFKHHEKYLLELINKENIWLSLSFNQNFMTQFLRIKTLLIKTQANNAQMNYCLNGDEEDPNSLPDFQVFHFRNNKKRTQMEKHNLHPSQVCAIFDNEGNNVEGHGTCDKCNNCHISYNDHSKGLKAPLPDQSIIEMEKIA